MTGNNDNTSAFIGHIGESIALLDEIKIVVENHYGYQVRRKTPAFRHGDIRRD